MKNQDAPRRIQLSRKKGWKLPPNTVVVSRPTRWGNPFVVGRDGSRATCVGLYEKLMAGCVCLSVQATPEEQEKAYRHAAQHIGELRGKNLACWCRTEPCHADVLLRLANAKSESEALFDKCVIKRCGGRSIECRLGLWKVATRSKTTSEREAMRYWKQYYDDGEYAALLSLR